MTVDTVRLLVEQARDYAIFYGEHRVNGELVRTLAGLADAVEQLTAERDKAWADEHVRRIVAEARVSELESGIEAHRERFRNRAPHLHFGTPAQAPNENLWELLDVGPSDRKDNQ